MTAPTMGRASRHDPAHPVVTLDWPAHRRRGEIARSGRAALLVVAPGHPPPEDLSLLEDWIRMPLDPVELAVRTDELRHRHRLRRCGVHVDDDGVLHTDDGQVALTKLQQALLGPLLAGIGQPVSRAEVERASACAGGPTRSGDLRRALARLRARLIVVGLGLHLLSGRALLLEPSVQRDSSQRGDRS